MIIVNPEPDEPRVAREVPVAVVEPTVAVLGHAPMSCRVEAALALHGIAVVASVERLEELSEDRQPHVVVIVGGHPDRDAAFAIHAVRTHLPQARVVLTVRDRRAADTRDALKAGADGVVVESHLAHALAAVVRAVSLGHAVVPLDDRSTVERLLDAGVTVCLSRTLTRARLERLLAGCGDGKRDDQPVPVVATVTAAAAPVPSTPLSNRELQILRCVAEGHTNARIGRDLWVTEHTVKFHLARIYRKLGVTNRTEASRYVLASDHGRAPPQAPAPVPASAPANFSARDPDQPADGLWDMLRTIELVWMHQDAVYMLLHENDRDAAETLVSQLWRDVPEPLPLQEHG
jgi:DNA-binding NarL/FixJ family response regulator